jgi:hypothetical protein
VFGVGYRIHTVAANVLISITQGRLNDGLNYRPVELPMHASDVAKAKDSIAAHVEVRVGGEANAQILSVPPIPVMHGNGDDSVTQHSGIVIT